MQNDNLYQAIIWLIHSLLTRFFCVTASTPETGSLVSPKDGRTTAYSRIAPISCWTSNRRSWASRTREKRMPVSTGAASIFKSARRETPKSI